MNGYKICLPGSQLPRVAVLSLICLLTFVQANAQYKLDEQVSFVYLDGTSTLHDWTVTVGQMKGSLQATVDNNRITKIDRARISIPVISMKSGKKSMDKNMHAALKYDRYPEISYRLKNHIIHDGTMTVMGELTIAGVTKQIKTKVTQEGIGKHIKIKGEVKVNMTEFNVQPPELLLGNVKTGDEVTITFYFMFCENGH